MSVRRQVAESSVPSAVRELCAELERAGFRAWVVGGCVRDILLGKSVSDWDLATSARPEEVQRTFRKVIPTGIQHGTVTVLWKGGSYEVTTLRGEGAYSDGRRPDSVHFVRTIEDDLARRDFTVNAIAFDPLTGGLVDPHGGLEDLDARLLRAVGDPTVRFSEDGLRILRAARFVATLDFELEAATEAAIPGALETFRRVSHERVQQEWVKALGAQKPSRAFEVMRRTGVLGITLPVLLDQVGCEQNQWHAHDVWNHTMAVLDASERSLPVRLAALLHDLGKPATRAHSDKTNDWTFYAHEQLGAKFADAWLREYRFSNDLRELVVALVRHHLVCYTREWTDAAVRRFVKRVGRERVAPLLALARADALGKGRPVDEELGLLDELSRRIEALAGGNAALSTRDLAVDGKGIMTHLGIPPSRRVGELLEALLERVLDDPSLNSREHLLAELDRLAADGGPGEP
ncbi:MAG: HD domain-containing protein [Myxococcales bacterium]|nr:HD domain-containing protein [Myxococcales bacterium]